MGWLSRNRETPKTAHPERGGLGIDMTARRALAVMGQASRNRVLPLEDEHADLPLTISLEHRTPTVGRAGVALLREMPHLACQGYLPYLGQPFEWKGGQHRLDAAGALALVFERLRVACAGFQDIFLGLPDYLTPTQVAKLTALAIKYRFPLKGTTSGILALVAERAAALHAWPTDTSSRPDGVVPLHRPGTRTLPFTVLVIDADDFALSASLFRIEAKEAKLIGTTTRPKLSIKQWSDRMLDMFADRCVQVCRRDPRDSGDAEQSLFEQIDESLDQIRAGRHVALSIRAAHWYQDLHLQPEDYEACCSPLIRSSVDSIRELLESSSDSEPPRVAWLTHEAGRLPGMAKAVHLNMTERTSVAVLRPEAIATAVASLGDRWLAGELPNAHLDHAIPVTLSLPESKQRHPSILSQLP
ncbi:MAG: hypothetical protein K8T89_20860 [Planctomycetes bacterium]|nr:hypothetical protein [Planctomycetota bacterium]